MAEKKETEQPSASGYVEPREAVDSKHRDAGQVYVDEQDEREVDEAAKK